MESAEENPFLDLVCAALRRSRPLDPPSVEYLSRVETVLGAPFVSLWFRTRGCRHDARGGCTMCNYGASSAVSPEQMVDSVRRGLAALGRHDDMTLLLSPSGSMFDEWEVPAAARDAIFRLARAVPMRAILCETRADTVREADLAAFSTIFGDREPIIGIGLESADPWVLKYCINKQLSLQDYRTALRHAQACGVTSTANILLGAPFLSVSEAVEDAVRSIQWAFETGTDSCVLFPSHVKRYTLVEWLWQRNMYTPPTLWALAEVLYRLGQQYASRVTISWYKDYFATGDSMPGTGESSFVASPSTCPSCHDAVMALLDEYRNTRDFSVVEALVDYDCACRADWQAQLESSDRGPLPERMAQGYESVGRTVLGDQWWGCHGADVLQEMRTEYSGGAHLAVNGVRT